MVDNILNDEDLHDAMGVALIDFNDDSDSVILMICKSHLKANAASAELGNRLSAVKSELMLMQGDTVCSTQAETHSDLVARLLTVVETGKDRYGKGR